MIKFSYYIDGFSKIINYFGIDCCKDRLEYTEEELKKRCFDQNSWSMHYFYALSEYVNGITIMFQNLIDKIKSSENTVKEVTGLDNELRLYTEKIKKDVISKANGNIISYNKDAIDCKISTLECSIADFYLNKTECD